jgi:hypothetical protein
MTVCKHCGAVDSITENGVRDDYVWRDLGSEYWESSLDYGDVILEYYRCEECEHESHNLEGLVA